CSVPHGASRGGVAGGGLREEGIHAAGGPGPVEHEGSQRGDRRGRVRGAGGGEGDPELPQPRRGRGETAGGAVESLAKVAGKFLNFGAGCASIRLDTSNGRGIYRLCGRSRATIS